MAGKWGNIPDSVKGATGEKHNHQLPPPDPHTVLRTVEIEHLPSGFDSFRDKHVIPVATGTDTIQLHQQAFAKTKYVRSLTPANVYKNTVFVEVGFPTSTMKFEKREYVGPDVDPTYHIKGTVPAYECKRSGNNPFDPNNCTYKGASSGQILKNGHLEEVA